MSLGSADIALSLQLSFDFISCCVTGDDAYPEEETNCADHRLLPHLHYKVLFVSFPSVSSVDCLLIPLNSLYGVEKKELEMRMTHSEIPRFHRPEQHAANEKKEKQKRAHERESTAVTERDRSKGTDRATSPMSVLSTGQGQRREKDPTKNTLRDLQRITSEGRPGKLRKVV